MDHVLDLDHPKTRTTGKGTVLRWTVCRLYVGDAHVIADADTPISCRGCAGTLIDRLDVPLVVPSPRRPAGDGHLFYVDAAYRQTQRAQQVLLPGIGTQPKDDELFSFVEVRRRTDEPPVATHIVYRT